VDESGARTLSDQQPDQQPAGTTPAPATSPSHAFTGSTRCVALPEDRAAFERRVKDAPTSLGALFLRRVADTPDAPAFMRPDGAGRFVTSTWGETGVVVQELAAGLLALGLQPEDRVAIASATRVEWIEADLAVMCSGGATTTIYPTSTPEDVHHILSDSGSRFLIAENEQQLAKAFAEDSAIETAILIDGTAPDVANVITFGDLRERGRTLLAGDPDAVAHATAAVSPESLATLIYTSGTTGKPKGVRISHSSWVYEGLATTSIGLVTADDLGYLWLPLSHSFGKVLLSTQIAAGHASAVDGDVAKIIANLPVVRPTTMAGAPRIFEKVYAGVIAATRSEGGAKLKIFEWAVGVGIEVSRLRQQGREPSGLLAVKHRVADKLVFSKVRDRFGGRMQLFVSGAAPLSRDIAEWFHAVGLLVVEGYGLTETSAAAFVNRPGHYEFGSVGLPMPGTEVAIADDGEIMVKGPGVMMGYHNLPDATAEVMTDGWLHTGDVGEISDNGSLRITDRKKDLIKTSGGKYVAPQSIETQFKAICPLAAQIVVHGDGRNFVTALVALDPDAIKVWAASNEMADASFGDVARSPKMRATMEAFVDQLNSGLGRWETIKKFEILDRELTVEEGDLTPSLKLKRRAVENRYRSTLDGFYQG
jgi:long-chain acyl-CoA synthetase